MPSLRLSLPVALSLLLGSGPATLEPSESPAPSPLAWPETTATSRPWSYWWWLGSAVDEAGLSSFLSRCRDAGMGGLHIIPIYGVRGLEERYVEYLSPRWLALLHFTCERARELGMDVDMSTGTGWPFGGGPQTTTAESCKKAVLEEYPYDESRLGSTLASRGRYQAVVALSPEGRRVDLLASAPPDGMNSSWHVYALGQTPSRGVVERAAPGAEGLVVDPFSGVALRRYLERFDTAFARSPGPLPRAQYHDSYEYPGATWTDSLLEEFQRRRGYDLRGKLPELFGRGDPEVVARVKADLRATVSELHVEFLRLWVDWAHGKGCLTRNQAHGSPTNLLDAYALADVPETESFGTPRLPRDDLHVGTQARTAPPHPLVMKFASSAAHTAGRRLTAAESCTWIAEHFNVPLWLAKLSIDTLFVAGVNHVVYHGMAYSPPDAAWPGWRFYASTNFSPTNSFWRDFPALNAYVARCQSVLQTGAPDADVLLYFPIHDVRHDPRGLLQHYTVHGKGWMRGGGLEDVATSLWTRGYGFDYVSDELLSRAKVSDGRILLGDGGYRAIVLPPCRLLPVETARKLVEIATDGGAVIFAGDVPGDVPGLDRVDERRRELRGVLRSLQDNDRVLHGDPLEALLDRAGIRREAMVDLGLTFLRRRHTSGRHYFVVNGSSRKVDAWVPLATECQSVVLLDPRWEDRVGLGSVRRSSSGAASVYLQLESGESVVLRTFDDRDVKGPSWRYLFPLTDTARPTLQLGESVQDESGYLPVSIHEASSEYRGREGPRMLDGSGLHATQRNTHSTQKAGVAWLAGGPPPQSVVLDLGEPRNLQGLRIWNYNESQDRPLMSRGAKDVTISVAADERGRYRVVRRVALKQAPGRDDVDFSETIPLEASGARYLKLEVVSNHGDEEYVGLAELRVLGEPQAQLSPVVRKLDTRWHVTFLHGEPEAPAPFETTALDSWTTLGDERARWVAGTARYSTKVTLPEHPGDWLLDLGRVADSARVRVNGQEIATLFSLPFSLPIGAYVKPGENILEIDVTNLDANRITDLDRRGIVWRKFHEINFVNIEYRPFDASSWPPRPSGLLGPVRLIPVEGRRPTVDRG